MYICDFTVLCHNTHEFFTGDITNYFSLWNLEDTAAHHFMLDNGASTFLHLSHGPWWWLPWCYFSKVFKGLKSHIFPIMSVYWEASYPKYIFPWKCMMWIHMNALLLLRASRFQLQFFNIWQVSGNVLLSEERLPLFLLLYCGKIKNCIN